uniref:Aquaporin 8b n=1 Tax=Electrophorus electricus TaxID=8005 RepID=A0AAY5EL77_ELEEL
MEVEKIELNERNNAAQLKTAAHPPGRFERLIQPCLAELVGTTFFVFIGCVSVIENLEAAGRLQPALAHGLAVAVMVACMAEISEWNIIFKMISQLCLFCKQGFCQHDVLFQVMTSKAKYMNATGAAFTILQSHDQLGEVFFAELAMTCLVTMVVLLGAVNGKSKSPLVPFMVGCTVLFNILAGGDVSGTCLNPARAFGPALLTNYWAYHWVYWVGPIGGALIAAALVRFLLGDEKTRIIMK